MAEVVFQKTNNETMKSAFIILALLAPLAFAQDRRALVDQTTGDILGYKSVERAAPVNPVQWVKVVEAGEQPPYDPATQKAPQLVRTVSPDRQTVTLSWADPVAYTQPELDAIAAEQADRADREAKRTTVGGAVATLRQWSDDAEGVTVTSGNAVATLQVMVDRMGVFFDRFADLLEAQRIDQ